MFQVSPRFNFMKQFGDNRPRAYAKMQGGEDHDEILGMIYFYEVPFGGLLIEAEVFGLPDMPKEKASSFYGFHIHDIGDCSEGFTKTGDHFNPERVMHPMHAGDLPPIISNDGYSWIAFYNNNLELYDIIGKSVVIHGKPDDFATQPSGNAGEKIACGVITFIDES